MTNQGGNRGGMNGERSKSHINQSKIGVTMFERIYSGKEQQRNSQVISQKSKGKVRNATNLAFYQKRYDPGYPSPYQGLQCRLFNYDKDEQDAVKNFPQVKNVTNSASKKTRKGPRGGVATPFPMKLYQLLDSKDHQAIISWQPHGRCFILRKPKEFLEFVMPRYFRQSKITSFQRQLNLYGFHRLTSGPDKGGYYHERFLRGKPALCEGMLRTRIKGKGSKSASNPEAEPNFYNKFSMDNFPCSIEDRPPSAVKDKYFMDSIRCYEQDSASPYNGDRNKIDTQITREDSSRKIEKCISSPVCVSSSAPFLDNSQVLPIKNMQSYKLCSPPERTLSGQVDDSDIMTFEGKGFHYINSNCFSSNGEHDRRLSDYNPPKITPITQDILLDMDCPCDESVLGFEWSFLESELI